MEIVLNVDLRQAAELDNSPVAKGGLDPNDDHPRLGEPQNGLETRCRPKPAG
jgi:hypothetical protein